MGYNGENDGVVCLISAIIYPLITKDIPMNKKKKLNQIHQKRLKAASAKLGSKKKSGYISKADRAKLENIETLEAP
jgi:hypothetical protein